MTSLGPAELFHSRAQNNAGGAGPTQEGTRLEYTLCGGELGTTQSDGTETNIG